jgi:hypothetical protein
MVLPVAQSSFRKALDWTARKEMAAMNSIYYPWAPKTPSTTTPNHIIGFFIKNGANDHIVHHSWRTMCVISVLFPFYITTLTNYPWKKLGL